MKRKFLLLSTILLLYWLCSSTFLRGNFGLRVRYFSDEYDRGEFFTRGLWLPEGKVPYRDTFSEYPQISTYLFGIVHIPFLNETDLLTVYGQYSLLFSLIMIYILLAVIIIIDQQLSDEKKKLALLFLLPAPLYFTYNRFDILPVIICLLALMMVQREKWAYAACLLGIGALTKWYPALLAPPILIYMFYKKESWKNILQFVLIFGLTCFLILLPTWIAGGSRALMVPYVNLQAKRGYDPGSFLGLILPFLQSVAPSLNLPFLKIVLLLMQFSAIPFLLLIRINTFEKLLNCCLIAVAVFMLFAPLYSPQWMLWIFPFMILVAKTKWDVSLIVSYGVITYLEFPLIYDHFGPESFEMRLMGLANVLLLLLIILQAIGRQRALSGKK